MRARCISCGGRTHIRANIVKKATLKLIRDNKYKCLLCRKSRKHENK